MTYVRVILEKHKAWLRGKAGGKRADLRGVDLRGVDLRGAHRFTAFSSICNTEYEVTGNIYDNPQHPMGRDR